VLRGDLCITQPQLFDEEEAAFAQSNSLLE
jgi:hypothetical protein